jgi:hypothetical protein
VSEFDEAPIAADGSFRCRIPAPAVVLRATIRPKLGANRGPQFLETELELGELALAVDATVDLPLVVDEGGSIEGVVVTAQGGFPIEGARVSIPWWSDSNDDWSCTTDADGRFRVSGIRREVAEARSNSEAVASAPGFVSRRFLVPPAEDGLDVTRLQLALERGVRIALELLPTDDLDEASRARWRMPFMEVQPTLQPRSASSAGPIAVLPWFDEDPALLESGSIARMAFAEIAPTTDALLVVRYRDGTIVHATPIDASIERRPTQLTVPLQPLPETPPADPGADGEVVLDVGAERFVAELEESQWPRLTIEFHRPDGSIAAGISVAARTFLYGVRVITSSTDEGGHLQVSRPTSTSAVELRVRGYESAWLAVNPAPRPDARLVEPLVVTLVPLTPAR